MAWLKILVFAVVAILFGVVGLGVDDFQLPLAISLTLLIGVFGFAVFVWLVAVDGSLIEVRRVVSSKVKEWRAQFIEPEIMDEKSEEFKALSHEQKIKVLQKKYAIDPIKFESKVRIRWIVVSGIVSLLVLIALWQFGQSNSVDSKVFSAAIALLVGAPVALMVWYFRDQNNVRELERQHHDVTLKEFQKLQEWATGNIADGYNQDGSQKKHAETLQISALHQLRPFLKGEFGESFKRSAYEIFRSVLETEHRKVLFVLEQRGEAALYNSVRSVLREVPLALQLNYIVADEWFNLLINHDFPVSGISLVGVDLNGKYLKPIKVNKDYGHSFMHGFNEIKTKCFSQGIDLSQSNLQGADLDESVLTGACFGNAKLEGALIKNANLIGASFVNADMNGAELSGSQLTLSIFQTSKMNFSCFSRAELLNASFSGCSGLGINFSGAKLMLTKMTFNDFRGAQLSNTDLRGSSLILTGFYGAFFDRADFRGSCKLGFKDDEDILSGAGDSSEYEQYCFYVDEDGSHFVNTDDGEKLLNKFKVNLGSAFLERQEQVLKDFKNSSMHPKLDCLGAIWGAYTKKQALEWIDQIKKVRSKIFH